MKNEVENILDICLKELLSGTDLESLLIRYPDYASEIKPLLIIALDVNQIPKPKPPKEEISATLIKIGKVASKEKISYKRSIWSVFFGQPKLGWVVSGVFSLILTVLALSTLSAQSTPGELLYPVKLITEKVRFFLTLNSENKAELRLTYSENRLDEMLKTSLNTGTIDTLLLKSMLNQAQLALEQGEISDEKTIPFLNKLQNMNNYQKNTLQIIRQSVDSSSKILLDKAIETCCSRDSWLDKIINDETQPTTDSKQVGKKKWQWNSGYGCE